MNAREAKRLIFTGDGVGEGVLVAVIRALSIWRESKIGVVSRVRNSTWSVSFSSNSANESDAFVSVINKLLDSHADDLIKVYRGANNNLRTKIGFNSGVLQNWGETLRKSLELDKAGARAVLCLLIGNYKLDENQKIER